MRRTVLVLLVSMLAAAACGGGETSEPTQSPDAVSAAETSTTAGEITTTVADATTTLAGSSTTTSGAQEPTTTQTEPEPTVEVVRNLVYGTGVKPAGLDVYYRPGAEGGPVVVLFHGGGVGKSYPEYPALGKAIAERGGVVFVPNWAVPVDPSYPTAPEDMYLFQDWAACAVSFSLVHAADYGADPDTLVLVGHSAGANIAAMTGLRDTSPVSDCAADQAPFVTAGMVLYEGDWMLGDTSWDNYGDGVPLLVDSITPWNWLADAPRMAVTFVTTGRGREDLIRCGVSDPAHPFWRRDPTGGFQEMLDAIGALDDDCVDIGEPTVVLADAMRDLGFDVAEVPLPLSSHDGLKPAERELVVDEVIAMAER